jgi:hypothetical protein
MLSSGYYEADKHSIYLVLLCVISYYLVTVLPCCVAHTYMTVSRSEGEQRVFHRYYRLFTTLLYAGITEHEKMMVR